MRAVCIKEITKTFKFKHFSSLEWLPIGVHGGATWVVVGSTTVPNMINLVESL